MSVSANRSDNPFFDGYKDCNLVIDLSRIDAHEGFSVRFLERLRDLFAPEIGMSAEGWSNDKAGERYRQGWTRRIDELK